MARNDEGFPVFDDEDVQSLIKIRDRLAADSRMPRSERKRVKREREKAEERKDRRFNVDIDTDLKDRTKKMAEKYRCPASQIVQLALHQFHDRVDAGEVELRDYLAVMDGNPRYEYRVERYKVPET